MMLFGGFQKTTLADYPGRIASIAFTLGCNFRCGYCHNPGLACGEANVMPEEGIIGELEARKRLVDAVVVTGGEPTIHAGLPQFLGALKRMGFSVKLDSNGSNPEMLERILYWGLVDYVAMDIKAPWKKYAEVCGVAVDTGKIMRSAELVKGSGMDYEFRCTAGPMLTEEDLAEAARQVAPAKRFFFQEFRSDVPLLDKTLEGKKGVSPARLEALAASLRR